MKLKFVFSLLFALTMCFSNVVSAHDKADNALNVELVATIQSVEVKETVAVNIITSDFTATTVKVQEFTVDNSYDISKLFVDNYLISNYYDLYLNEHSCWSNNYNHTYIQKNTLPEHTITSTYKSPRDTLRVG